MVNKDSNIIEFNELRHQLLKIVNQSRKNQIIIKR